MWPGYRQLVPSLLSIVFLASANSPLYAGDKRFSQQNNAQIISIREEQSGNFVLLNTDKRKQLPFPSMRYLPGNNGKAVLAIDFPGTIDLLPARSFTMPNSDVEFVHIGQFLSNPPITRITLIARDKQAFKQVQIKGQAGSLSIQLPDKLNISNAYPPVAPNIVRESMAQLRGPITLPNSPPPATPALIQAKPTPIKPPQLKTVQLKSPLTIGDATYTPINNPKLVRPAPAIPIPTVESHKTVAIPPFRQPFTGQAFQTVLAEEKQLAAEKQPMSKEQSGQITLATINDALKINVSGNDPLTVQICGNTPLTYNTFRLHEPERVVIDIDSNQPLSLPAPPEVPNNPWIKAIRIGILEASKTVRIVFDLAQDKSAIAESSDDKHNTINLIVNGESPSPTATAMMPPKHISGCTIVLDAGHGGSDPGAQRGDIQEKEITLQIVDKLKRSLESRGVSIRMTRSDDIYVSLEERVRITNELQPDAFVSVHINSLETNNGTHGIETYFQTEKSKNLAQLIHNTLVKKLEAPDRSVRKARFYVINHTPVPAILAEVGFISNKDERDKLISSDYQIHIAQALADGVMLYLAQTRQASAVPNKAAPNGTIANIAPSARAQSFTQNLHSPTHQKVGLKQSKLRMALGIRAKRQLKRVTTKLAHQQLKFKKSRLAFARS